MENYYCGKRIGRGSYGEVWLVKSKRDKKQYVLKQINLQYASKRELRAANLEVQLLATLKHPNIVSYRDSFESQDGFLYIVMGYCEGGDLYSQIKLQNGIPFEESQIVEWFIQISMALQYLHERNILHRDLKTQNIFLTKSKIIKVGDLGIAKVLDGDSAMATTLIGTPYYMSPELFSNRPYNHKSDVWALGCCIYEIATLRHAFNARDMNSLMYKIIRGKLPAMPKKYSADLQDLIRGLLNHNPDKRPSVSRILRHPYIKKNIAIFLEGTRLRQKVPCQSERSLVYIVNPRKPEQCPSSKGTNSKAQEAKSKADVREDVQWLAVQGTKLSKETETQTEAAKVHNSGGAISAQINNASTPSECIPKTAHCKNTDAASACPSQGEVLSLIIDGQEIKLEDRFSDRRSSDSSNGSGKSQSFRTAPPSKKASELAAVSNGYASPSVGRDGSVEHVRKINRMRCLNGIKSKHERDRDPKSVPSSAVDQCARSKAISLQRRPNKEARQRRRQKLLEQNHMEPDSFGSTEHPVLPNLSNNELPIECSNGDDDVQGASPPGSLSTNSNSDRDYEHLIDLLNSTLKIDLESPPSSASLTPEKRHLDSAPNSETDSGVRCASRLELRINALESDCLQGLGKSLLSKAMEAIVSKDARELQDELLIILGKDKYNGFIGKLWQLKLCQESIQA